MTIISSLGFLYIFRGCGLLCAIAFFRALFGFLVLNFSSHFLLLTPPGKKTTTGDTTSSLKNYVQNKSYYIPVFSNLLTLFLLNEKSSVVFEFVFWSIRQKSKSVTFCAPRLFMCQCVNLTLPSEQTKLYQKFKREKLEIFFKCYFVF